MNIFDGWYTDSVDVYRTSNNVVGHIKKQSNSKRGTYSCRIHKSQKGGPLLNGEAGRLMSSDVLSVPIGTDIISGDELIVTRGGNLGYSAQERYFAGEIVSYYEPVANVFNGLAHMEIGLLLEEVIK